MTTNVNASPRHTTEYIVLREDGRILLAKREPTAYDAERARNKETNKEVAITIRTFVPSKWRFQDLETGDVWKWDGTFKKA